MKDDSDLIKRMEGLRRDLKWCLDNYPDTGGNEALSVAQSYINRTYNLIDTWQSEIVRLEQQIAEMKAEIEDAHKQID